MLIGIIIAVVLVIIGITVKNGIIKAKNQIDFATASLDAELKKRYDLIPNLVSTVKQYSTYEESVLTKITELRSKAMQGALSEKDKAELDDKFQHLQRSFTILSENYPELKASENYLQLQRSLNETEAQIVAARRTVNACITDFNNKIQTFPGSMFAGDMQPVALPKIQANETENVNVNDLFKQ